MYIICIIERGKNKMINLIFFNSFGIFVWHFIRGVSNLAKYQKLVYRTCNSIVTNLDRVT